MPVDKDKMKALALAAEKDGQHVYTYPRDSNKWKENTAWCDAASPEAFLELLAENDKLDQERDELRAEVERLREVLLKIERVNAMDYEYRRWAREAVNNR